MKSSMNCRLYVPSRFTPGSQSPPVWPVSVPEPTYPVFTGPVTFKLPAHPPPPTPCVRPFHAPWMLPVPPSRELRGRPTRMLMFCSGDSPYSTSTWQYDFSAPHGAMIALVRLLMTGWPSSPSAGSVASWLHITGRSEGPAGLSFAGAGDAFNAAPITTAVNHNSVRFGIVFLLHVSVLRASVAHIDSRSPVTPSQRNGVSDTRWSCPIFFSYDWHWLFLWRFRAFARKKEDRRCFADLSSLRPSAEFNPNGERI